MRSASRASSTPSSTEPGSTAGCSRSCPSARPARKWRWAGPGRGGGAAARQRARAAHDVTLFEKNDRVGGLLRYGIPDFKMEKTHIDRRVKQLEAEGVTIRTGVFVGSAKDGLGKGSKVTN